MIILILFGADENSGERTKRVDLFKIHYLYYFKRLLRFFLYNCIYRHYFLSILKTEMKTIIIKKAS